MDTRPQLGLWPHFPTTNVRPAALPISLTIVCCSRSASIGLINTFVAHLLAIDWVVFYLALYTVSKHTHRHAFCKKSIYHLFDHYTLFILLHKLFLQIEWQWTRWLWGRILNIVDEKRGRRPSQYRVSMRYVVILISLTVI